MYSNNRIAAVSDEPHHEDEGFSDNASDNGEIDAVNESEEPNEFKRSVAITDNLTRLYKALRDHYSARFSELENLISSPILYCKAVAILLNEPLNDIKSLATNSDNMVGEPLNTILDGPTLMTVAVVGTTVHGRELDAIELSKVTSLCQRILELDRERLEITAKIEASMNETAPNLAVLVGAQTAAQFVNAAGGLTQLSTMPACNLGVIGARKQGETGFATNKGVRSQGYLAESPILRDVPIDSMKQGIRIVSGKVVLAARVDACRQQRDGSFGRELMEQCRTRLDKLSQAAPSTDTKALPAPDDKPSTKRGGQRARKAKEATSMTEMRKAQNRVAFGKEESEVGYGTGSGTVGLGMLGQEDRGNIRRTQINKATAAKLSKNNQGWGSTSGSGTVSLDPFAGGASLFQPGGLRTSGVGQSDAAGTASTIAFTPAQGLDLVDPTAQTELKRKRKAEEDRWFKLGSFTQVPNQDSGEDGEFKVPALPSKKVDTGEGKTAPK